MNGLQNVRHPGLQALMKDVSWTRGVPLGDQSTKPPQVMLIFDQRLRARRGVNRCRK